MRCRKVQWNRLGPKIPDYFYVVQNWHVFFAIECKIYIWIFRILLWRYELCSNRLEVYIRLEIESLRYSVELFVIDDRVRIHQLKLIIVGNISLRTCEFVQLFLSACCWVTNGDCTVGLVLIQPFLRHTVRNWKDIYLQLDIKEHTVYKKLRRAGAAYIQNGWVCILH